MGSPFIHYFKSTEEFYVLERKVTRAAFQKSIYDGGFVWDDRCVSLVKLSSNVAAASNHMAGSRKKELKFGDGSEGVFMIHKWPFLEYQGMGGCRSYYGNQH